MWNTWPLFWKACTQNEICPVISRFFLPWAWLSRGTITTNIYSKSRMDESINGKGEIPLHMMSEENVFSSLRFSSHESKNIFWNKILKLDDVNILHNVHCSDSFPFILKNFKMFKEIWKWKANFFEIPLARKKRSLLFKYCKIQFRLEYEFWGKEIRSFSK